MDWGVGRVRRAAIEFADADVAAVCRVAFGEVGGADWLSERNVMLTGDAGCTIQASEAQENVAPVQPER